MGETFAHAHDWQWIGRLDVYRCWKCSHLDGRHIEAHEIAIAAEAVAFVEEMADFPPFDALTAPDVRLRVRALLAKIPKDRT